MRRLWRESVVDGFEFQNLGEWDDETPPRADGDGSRRLASWKESAKYTTDQIAAMLQETGLPILSVHANRDVGICLCSEQPQDIVRGKQLIHQSLSLAEKVGAGVCVLHLWDTWKDEFAPLFLKNILGEIALQYPDVKACVENIPTHLTGFTPFDLVKEFDRITLDLRWAALYDEFAKFESLKGHIANVHLSGRLEGNKWVMLPAWFSSPQKSFGFYEALNTIRDRWRASGVLTVEAGVPRDSRWENLVAAMASLRR